MWGVLVGWVTALTEHIGSIFGGFVDDSISWVSTSTIGVVRWLRHGYRWRRLFAVSLVALAALTGMSRLDAVLRKMHPADGFGVAGGVTSIAKPLAKAKDARALTESWMRWDKHNAGTRSATTAIEKFDKFNTHLV